MSSAKQRPFFLVLMCTLHNYPEILRPLHKHSHRLIPLTKASDAEFLMFSLICAWINGWVNNCKAGDLRRHYAHYHVTVSCIKGILLVCLSGIGTEAVWKPRTVSIRHGSTKYSNQRNNSNSRGEKCTVLVDMCKSLQYNAIILYRTLKGIYCHLHQFNPRPFLFTFNG